MTDSRTEASDTLREAERLVQQTTTAAAIFLARTLARAREEGEDMWAEAKNLSGSRKVSAGSVPDRDGS